jgi:hypothetical protein
MCTIERAREGGLVMKSQVAAPPEWPREVAETDLHVARLPVRHLAAVLSHYFYLALHSERRAEIYVVTVREAIRIRIRAGVKVERGSELGPRAFKQDLDRARWTLKFALLV